MPADVLTFGQAKKEVLRDLFRQRFLEWLCASGDLQAAKKVAALSNADFDRLCEASGVRYG